MDLDQIETRETVTFNVKHPGTGEDLLDDDRKPMTVTVHTAISPVYKRAMFDAAERLAGGEVGDKYEQRQRLTLEALAASVKEWSIHVGGKVPASDKKSVLAVFAKHAWLADQIADAAQDRAGFFTSASAKRSST